MEEDKTIPCINLDGGLISTESSISEEEESFGYIIRFLDEMNLDLVFYDFDVFKECKMDWLARFEFNEKQIRSTVFKIGKRMIFYSQRVMLEVVFLLTDLLHQCPGTYLSLLAYSLIDEDILNGLRILLSTTCHLIIRSVLIFIDLIVKQTRDDFSRIILSVKLNDKIEWVGEQIVPMNYLSDPSLSQKDTIIEDRLKIKSKGFTIQSTHDLAKKILKTLAKPKGENK